MHARKLHQLSPRCVRVPVWSWLDTTARVQWPGWWSWTTNSLTQAGCSSSWARRTLRWACMLRYKEQRQAVHPSLPSHMQANHGTDHQARTAFEGMRRTAPHQAAGIETYSTVLWHLKDEVRSSSSSSRCHRVHVGAAKCDRYGARARRLHWHTWRAKLWTLTKWHPKRGAPLATASRYKRTTPRPSSSSKGYG